MEEKNKKSKTNLKDWAQDRFDLDKVLKFFSAAFVYGELEARLTFKEALEKALKKPVPKHINFWYCFGGISFLLFIIQVVTGILLAFYYKPTPETAYESVKTIMTKVPLGWLIREIHAWGANLMIAAVIIHMLRTFFHKAYRAPREMHWISGVILLFMTCTFGFSGYLLPWDQLSYWATKVGTEIAGAFPFVGEYILLILRGGPEISGATLTRFFAIHVMVLPWIVTFALVAHFLMIRKTGISKPL